MPFDRGSALLPVQEIVRAEPSYEQYNVVNVLRQIPTQETTNLKKPDLPYENANITLGIIDPNNPPLPIMFSSTYVLEDSLASIQAIDNDLLERTGKSLPETQDLTVIRDPFGQEQYRIAPIILEKWTNANGEEYLMVADGNNRLYHYLSQDPPPMFAAVIIDGIDEKYRPIYQPVNVDNVSVVKTPPPLEKKRRLPEHYDGSSYQNLRPDFRIVGSQGPRSSTEEMIKNTSLRPLVESPSGEPKPELANKIKKGFDGFAPPPHERITYPRATDHVAEILDFYGISPVCRTIGLANFLTDYGDGVAHEFKLLVKTKVEYESTATRGTLVIDRATAERFANSSVPVADEFVISPQMQNALATELLQHEVGIPALQLASSENPLAPRVVGVHVDSQNRNFYSTIVMRLSNQEEVSIVLNRPRLDNRGRLNFGTITLVRDPKGNVLLGYRHREPLGAAQLEAFRMYGYDQKRLSRDLGGEIVSSLEPVSSHTIGGLGAVDNTPTTFDIYTTKASESSITKIAEANRTYLDFAESTPPVRMSVEQVHQFIAEGRFGDALTISALTVNQIINNELVLNPQFDEACIVMEEVFNPLSGNQLIVPKLPLSMADRFSPMNVDMGKTLDVEYSSKALTVGQLESISNEKRLVPLQLNQLRELILAGKIDYNSLAHLSVLLRRQGVWQLSNQQS